MFRTRNENTGGLDSSETVATACDLAKSHFNAEARPYDWDALAGDWREEHPQVLWRAHSDAVNTAFLERWLPAGGIGRLLKTDLFDEAFGSGLYPLLASRAQSVIGIDVSQQVLATVRSHYPQLSVVEADVRRLPFADGALDVIVSLSTLDHFQSFQDIPVSLREFHRVLRPQGQLVITLDNLANPLVALRNELPFRLLNRLGIVPYYVGTTCGPRRLQRLLSEAGMEVLEIAAIMHCPRVIAVAVAGMLHRVAGAGVKARYLTCLMLVEKLQALPTRFLTGNFVAARAVKQHMSTSLSDGARDLWIAEYDADTVDLRRPSTCLVPPPNRAQPVAR